MVENHVFICDESRAPSQKSWGIVFETEVRTGWWHTAGFWGRVVGCPHKKTFPVGCEHSRVRAEPFPSSCDILIAVPLVSARNFNMRTADE